MELQELLTEFRPAYLDSWSNAVRELLGYPPERNLVFDLADELEARGHFDEPVVLMRADPDDDRPARVANGMHRITAHVITCKPEVAVTFAYPECSGAVLELSWQLPKVPTEEQIEECQSLLSFRLDADHWFECDGIAVSNRTLYVNAAGIPEDLGPRALERVTGRLQAAGLVLQDGAFEAFELPA